MISVARAGKGKLHIMESKAPDGSPELFCGRDLTDPVVWSVDSISEESEAEFCKVCYTQFYSLARDEAPTPEETEELVEKLTELIEEAEANPTIIHNSLTGRQRHGQTKADRDRRRQQMKRFLHG